MIEKNNVIELPIEKRVTGGYKKTFRMKTDPFPVEESRATLNNISEFLRKRAIEFDAHYLFDGACISFIHGDSWRGGYRVGDSTYRVPGGIYEMQIIAETPEKISDIERILFSK